MTPPCQRRGANGCAGRMGCARGGPGPFRAGGRGSPGRPALPATAFVRLNAALLAGGLIMYDVPNAHAVDEELSSAGVADGG